jgi:CheY-like chemotaxis protein
LTTLLAVDDSNTMRKVMEITFAGEDFRTVLAANTSQALEQLQQSGATVAVVDSALGGENGYELCQRIKGVSPQTRVLLLSSKQNPFDPGRGAAAGADDHMDKPFDTQTLIDRVRALVTGVGVAPVRAPQPAVQAPVAQPVAARAVVPQPPAAMPVPIPRSTPLGSGAAQPPIAATPIARPVAPVQPVGPSEPPDAITIEPQPGAQALAPIVVPPAAAVPAQAAAPAQARAVSAVPAAVNGSINGLEGRLSGLGLTPDQVQGVLKLSRDVIEQVVWEVVPALAEALIKEEIARLTK